MKENKAEVYKRLFGYLRPYRGQLVVGYVSMFVAALLNLFGAPNYQKRHR